MVVPSKTKPQGLHHHNKTLKTTCCWKRFFYLFPFIILFLDERSSDPTISFLLYDWPRLVEPPSRSSRPGSTVSQKKWNHRKWTPRKRNKREKIKNRLSFPLTTFFGWAQVSEPWGLNRLRSTKRKIVRKWNRYQGIQTCQDSFSCCQHTIKIKTKEMCAGC